MINWLPSILIAGRVEIPGLFGARTVLVSVTSTVAVVWRRAGYLRVEAFFQGEYITVSSRAIDFGQSLIEIPVTSYRLSFDPVRDLTTLYPNTSIAIYPLTIEENQSIIMGINFAPTQPEQLSDEVVTTVAASITNVVLDPSNPARRGGFIVNKSNRNLWVRFGATAATAATPTSLVTPNSNINIPAGYTGAINGIWSASNPTLNAEIHQFNAI